MKPRQVRQERKKKLPGKGYVSPQKTRYDPIREEHLRKQMTEDVEIGMQLVQGGILLLQGKPAVHPTGQEVTGKQYGPVWLTNGKARLVRWVTFLTDKAEKSRVNFWIRHAEKALEGIKGK